MWDEAIFYSPAINYLDGRGLTSNMAADAPHPEHPWSYHGPFFPRLEVVGFYLFGISPFASRIFSLLGGHLAVLILCTCLLRAGLFRSAIGLVLLQLGDYSLKWTLVARPEGTALLCLAGAFASLLSVIRTGSARSAFAAGLLSAAAVGLHPVTVFFACGTGVVILWKAGFGKILWFLWGTFAVAVLLCLCCLPNLSASLEQFLWHAGKLVRNSLWETLHDLYPYLQWGMLWILCLIAINIGLGCMLIVAYWQRRSLDNGNRGTTIAACALLYGACS